LDKGEREMRKLKAKDVKFFFGGCNGSSVWHEANRWTCGACGRKFYDHGLSVVLEGGGYTGPWVGEICGDCLTSDTKHLAEIMRGRAPILREMRPKRGDDADTNIRWADNLLLVAALFDALDSLDAITGGTFARRIGEGYKELNNPPKAGKARKAA
jgi:hypothetical protein